jgi:hypothetical protein
VFSSVSVTVVFILARVLDWSWLSGNGLRHLFANDIFRCLISSQPQEHRLTQLIIECPLGKFDLDNQYGVDPLATFHDRRGDA